MIFLGFLGGVCDRSVVRVPVLHTSLEIRISLQDIWAMVFLAIQPNLASPDLATLRDQRLFFGKGHKNTAGESGKTSMDSEVRSCWERFQDIYPPVI